MTQLMHYDAARLALAEAIKFDDVLAIKDVAKHAELYARQARDTELIERATEIKVRAERRAGQMLTEAKESGDLRGKGNPQWSSASTIGLEAIGITKNESSRWQKLALVNDSQFEDAIAESKDAGKPISVKAVLAKTATPKPEKEVAPVVVAPVVDNPEDYVMPDESDSLPQIAENLQKERDAAVDLVKRYESTDVKKVTDDYDRLHNRLLCETQEKNEWIRKYNFQADLLKKICIAVGVKSSFDILAKLSKS